MVKEETVVVIEEAVMTGADLEAETEEMVVTGEVEITVEEVREETTVVVDMAVVAEDRSKCKMESRVRSVLRIN